MTPHRNGLAPEREGTRPHSLSEWPGWTGEGRVSVAFKALALVGGVVIVVEQIFVAQIVRAALDEGR